MELSHCETILIFGGSFDPPHIGHVVLPMLAMEAIGADAVAYIPAANPPHKPQGVHAAGKDRLKMLQLALDGLDFAHVLDLELTRATNSDRASYTIETLVDLRDQIGSGPRFRLLMGGDQLRSFDAWREPARIVELAEPVVMVRPPDTAESLLENLPKGFDRAIWAPRLVGLPQFDVSSTLIRERCRNGWPIRGLTLRAIEQYVRDHRLFDAK